jgi:uncharacterized protein YbbC (DUF1343 family)
VVPKPVSVSTSRQTRRAETLILVERRDRWVHCQAMQSGLDRLAAGFSKCVEGKRVALICNHTSIDRFGKHAVEIIQGIRGTSIPLLMGPEHGIWGTHQDMEAVDEDTSLLDPVFHLPVASLYGDDVNSLKPQPELLSDVDVVVFDVQDIGTRYYTYAATLAFAMETAAKANVPVVVLDRPNPIGHAVEGPLLRPGFESFVGIEPGLPIRHGMTLGQLGRWYGERRAPSCDLTIIDCDKNGMPTWIPPSPNMPTVDTAYVYPGMCLLEGTTLSEGRGTTAPFLLFGAPGIDPIKLCKRLMSYDCPGLDFVPRVFRPEFGKHGGEMCGGAYIRVFDQTALRAVDLGVYVLAAVKDVAPDAFKWRKEAYEFVKDIPAIDLLWGSEELRMTIDNGTSVSNLIKSSWSEAAAFKR